MLQAVQRGEAVVDDDSGDDTNGPDETRGHRPQAPLTMRAMDRSEGSGRMPAPSEVAPASTQDDAPYFLGVSGFPCLETKNLMNQCTKNLMKTQDTCAHRQFTFYSKIDTVNLTVL